MKYCRRCRTNKSVNEFYTRRNGTQTTPYCKLCHNLQAIERQRELKKLAVEYKGGCCVICGYNKCQAALEFHHREMTSKEFGISHIKSTKFDSRVTNELDKCDLLCSNCHRETHWLLSI